MLKKLLYLLRKNGRKARARAEAMKERIRGLKPPCDYDKVQPWHIPDPKPDSLPWTEPRKK